MSVPQRAAAVLLASSLGACQAKTETQPPAAASSEVETLQIVDATPEFLAFLQQGGEAPFDDETEAFLTSVVEPHAELYSAEVIGFDEAQAPKEVLASVLPEYLPYAYAKTDRIESVLETLVFELPQHRQSFEDTFGALAKPTTIYLTSSLGSFDGGTRMIEGEPALLFGVDGIAFFHPPDNDLAPLIHHELFHIHHGFQLEAAGAEPVETTVGQMLWVEGLATFVSRELNPDASWSEVLLSDDMIRDTEARLPELAAELADNLASTDHVLIADYFVGDSGDRVPERCGYYIGMRVAEQMRQSHSLNELATMYGANLDVEIEAALRELAKRAS